MDQRSETNQYTKINRGFQLAAGVSVIVLSFGTVFYHLVEKFTWVDSIYFCVITLTTIGYGDVVPKTNLGKLFTVVYVLIGVGIISALVSLTVRRAALKRDKNHKR